MAPSSKYKKMKEVNCKTDRTAKTTYLTNGHHIIYLDFAFDAMHTLQLMLFDPAK